MRLAAQIDSDLISMVTQRATNVITMADSTTGTQGRDLWNCAAGIDATMTAIGVPQGINRRSFWNPFNYKDLAGELGHRAYAQGATLTAYEKAQIPTGQGPQVMTATTEQGATLIMSYAFDHIKGVTTARFTTLYGCSVLVPEYTGIVIAGQ